MKAPMQLTSLRNTSDSSTCEPCSPEKYGYGLRIYLGEAECEALGIKKALAAGTQVTITAKALVVSGTEAIERDGDDAGPDVSMSLQITDMGIEAGQAVKNAAQILYGDS